MSTYIILIQFFYTFGYLLCEIPLASVICHFAAVFLTLFGHCVSAGFPRSVAPGGIRETPQRVSEGGVAASEAAVRHFVQATTRPEARRRRHGEVWGKRQRCKAGEGKTITEWIPHWPLLAPEPRVLTVNAHSQLDGGWCHLQTEQPITLLTWAVISTTQLGFKVVLVMENAALRGFPNPMFTLAWMPFCSVMQWLVVGLDTNLPQAIMRRFPVFNLGLIKVIHSDPLCVWCWSSVYSLLVHST